MLNELLLISTASVPSTSSVSGYGWQSIQRQQQGRDQGRALRYESIRARSACVKCALVSTADLVTRHIADPQTSWAIGTFGAIAEFHRDADEAVALSAHGAITTRGGIRLRLMSPTRVFLSRLGRVEVCTPIPKPEGRTPEGPHTHVLRDLLRRRRTHSANVPLPHCALPCAEMFPASPIHDAHGGCQQFDIAKHETFQRLLAEHGDSFCMKAKSETVAAIRAGRPPFDEPSYNRAQRLARRVALRQIAQTDGPSRLLAAWQKIFDSV